MGRWPPGGARGRGQPKRRTFTAACKLNILEQYDELEDPAERGALLRREAQPTLNTRSMTSAPVEMTGRNSLRYTVSVVDVVLWPTR
jgi:hypothetical protein